MCFKVNQWVFVCDLFLRLRAKRFGVVCGVQRPQLKVANEQPFEKKERKKREKIKNQPRRKTPFVRFTSTNFEGNRMK